MLKYAHYLRLKNIWTWTINAFAIEMFSVVKCVLKTAQTDDLLFLPSVRLHPDLPTVINRELMKEYMISTKNSKYNFFFTLQTKFLVNRDTVDVLVHEYPLDVTSSATHEELKVIID